MWNYTFRLPRAPTLGDAGVLARESVKGQPFPPLTPIESFRPDPPGAVRMLVAALSAVEPSERPEVDVRLRRRLWQLAEQV